MIPFRKSLAFRLLGISIILLALPLLVDSFVIVQKGYEDAIKDAKGHLIEEAHSKELPLSQMQPVKRPMLVVMEDFFNLKKEFPTTHDEKFDKKLEEIAEAGDLFGLFLLELTEDKKLVVTVSSLPEHKGRDYTDFFKLYDIYSKDTFERGFINLVAYDPKTLQPFFLVARVIYSEKDKKPIGVLMVAGEAGRKLDKLLLPDEQYYTVHFALMLPDSIIFASSDPTMQFQYFSPIDAAQKALFLKEEPFAKGHLPDAPISVINRKDSPFIEFIWNGEEQIGYMSNLTESDITLLTFASKKAIFMHPNLMFLNIYGGYALILVVGGILALFLIRRLSRPMQQLSLVMGDIQKGHLEQRYRRDPLGYEINKLGSIFNEMVDTLLQKQKLAQEERIKRERYAKELLIGREVQHSLLPGTMPKYPGVELAEVYLPAKEVGGDFYDVFIRGKNNDELVLAVADASGKGVQACFYSLDVRSMLRTYAQKFDAIQSMLSKTNTLFCQDTGDTGMFVTALVGIYNHEMRTLRYYSAGHNPLLLRRANGEVSFLDHMGAALGIEGGIGGEEQTVQLATGDHVVFYTDGITEAHNEQLQLFGDDRLMQAIGQSKATTAPEMVSDLLKEVERFVGDAPQHDDITLLILKVI